MGKLENKTRNYTADFLKGIMIFCVMYGHSISMINGLRGVTWQKSIVNVFVTTFEMPLFILISGYFLWFSLRKKNYFKVLWKRIVSIVLPLLVWEGIPETYYFITKTINDGFLLSNLMKIGWRLIYPVLWFLACYLICTIFVILTEWLLSRIENKKVKIALSVIIYSTLIIGLHSIKSNFNNVPFMFPFFLVGFILSKYSLLKKRVVRKVIWGLAALFIVLYPFYKPEISFYILGSCLRDNTWDLLPIVVYRFVLGLAGCSLIYLIADNLCKRAVNNRIVSFTINLGTKTLELYILSMFIQDILIKIVRMLIKDYSVITDITAPLLFGPLFLAVMTAICLLIDHLIHKSSKLHRVIFGR